MLWSRAVKEEGTGLNGTAVLPRLPLLTRDWGWERGILGIVVLLWCEFIIILK